MNSTSSIITIGREYGSGGRQIGQEVAKYFGIKCYDKELLEHAANDSGICKELFEHHDEKPTNSFLYSLVMDTYSFGYSSSGFSDMPMNHKIFLAQFDAIKSIAKRGSVRIGWPLRRLCAARHEKLPAFLHWSRGTPPIRPTKKPSLYLPRFATYTRISSIIHSHLHHAGIKTAGLTLKPAVTSNSKAHEIRDRHTEIHCEPVPYFLISRYTASIFIVCKHTL